ncbi:MAG: hypothetical protein ISS82_05935 [Nanoarchaeota archaeon]|nr:hypothetical protein [Nanoarchaeota archaeon]
MVDAEQFKRKIEEIISQDYKIEFLGKNFNQIVGFLTDTKAEKIYRWVLKVVKKNIQPITIASKKQYKKWAINQLLVFLYRLNINNVEYRIFLLKVKNSIYIEFHLSDHKYYDKIRKDLNLKKTSY